MPMHHKIPKDYHRKLKIVSPEEAVACIKAITDGMVHPTINYQVPDPACDLDYVPNQARKHNVNVVLSNAFGFGGQNACLVFRKFDDAG